MYINGVLEDQVEVIGRIKISPMPMWLGANPNKDPSSLGSNYSKISAKKVMIYNRALTEEEIKQNYNIDKIRFGM